MQGLCLLSGCQLSDEVSEVQLVRVVEAHSCMVFAKLEQDARGWGLLLEGQVVGEEVLLEERSRSEVGIGPILLKKAIDLS